MNDTEVLQMDATLKSGTRLAWLQSGEAKEIAAVVPLIESDNEEIAEPGPCGLLVSGGWIALDNVDPGSIFVIKPLFP